MTQPSTSPLHDTVATLARLLLVLLLAGVAAVVPRARAVVAPSTPNGAELALEVKKLAVVGSVLYVAAHPDDENTDLLAYLSKGRLARTAYLSLTRGDGGQNLIGDELGDLLGLIRTQELLEARHRDGAEQIFTRAIDFGYSKNVEEALAVWGKEEVLADVVRVIRRFRPDVIVMRFPGDGRGGHGQHVASAVLALEAFDAAADSTRFPDQLEEPENLRPWRATRLVWDAARFFGGSEGSPENGVTMDTGSYSPELGQSFTEIAATSRSMHKSQGFGATGSRGTRVNTFEHRKGAEARDDLFDGIDTSWSRFVGGAAVGDLLEQAAAVFDPSRPYEIVPLLLRALEQLEPLHENNPDATVWLATKQRDLERVIQAACGLWLEAVTTRPLGVAGDPIELALRAVNRSPVAIELDSLTLPFGSNNESLSNRLEFNQLWQHDVDLRVPADYPVTQPYWLAESPVGALYRVADPRLIGLPESPPITARFGLRIAGREIDYDVPLLYRFTERVDGERYRRFEITPRLEVSLEGDVLVFPSAEPQQIGVLVHAPAQDAASLAGTLSLRLPAGWTATPATIPFEVEPESSARYWFELRPASDTSTSTAQLVAEARLDADPSRAYASAVRTIDYPHIPAQIRIAEASARVVRVELERRGELIGYVEGAGDAVPEALRRVGYQVVQLSDEDLASDELGIYDAIVTGVRAYNARDALESYNHRLLEYVERGGTLVVQYNTASRRGGGPSGIGPYPFRVSRERVSVEEAPVTLLAPTHPALQSPNRISEADFAGWVQERGLYFPNEWDEQYQPLLSSHDPDEPAREGGLLYAEYGKGVYVYTGYSFFRELPAGVPGAYRLFVNLVSARQAGDG